MRRALITISSAEDLPSLLSSIVQSTGCDLHRPARVAFARDTR